MLCEGGLLITHYDIGRSDFVWRLVGQRVSELLKTAQGFCVMALQTYDPAAVEIPVARIVRLEAADGVLVKTNCLIVILLMGVDPRVMQIS